MFSHGLCFLTGLCSKLERQVTQQMVIKHGKIKEWHHWNSSCSSGEPGGHQKDKVNTMFCCYQQARIPEQKQLHVQNSSSAGANHQHYPSGLLHSTSYDITMQLRGFSLYQINVSHFKPVVNHVKGFYTILLGKFLVGFEEPTSTISDSLGFILNIKYLMHYK